MRNLIRGLKVALFCSLVTWGCSKQKAEDESGLSDIPAEKAATVTSVLYGGTSTYVVFAWNDLGMHCLNPSYDKMVILPPYNNLKVQVVKRGKVPTVVTTGLTVSYAIDNNTYSVGKQSYGQFWTYAQQLFGVTLAPNIGLAGNGLSGNMKADAGFFSAEGIPVVPVYDSGVKDPYQQATITVKDATGKIVATTKTVIPTSDEINCAKCHGANAFDDILTKHDLAHQTNLMNSKPVLCATCHASPALSAPGNGTSKFLSQAIHGFHATKGATCYDCHPGATTKCSRSTRHTAADGNCVTCHGTMANVASTIAAGRVPWVGEPNCVSCHTGVTGIDTGTALYKTSHGHGNLFCSACHGSPHAMVPSLNARDNYQELQYQGSANPVKSIGSCGVCHKSSRGGDATIQDFAEKHAGPKPLVKMSCHTCHTEVTSETAKWPHSFQWKNSGGNPKGV